MADKITKVQYLEMIKGALEAAETENKEELVAFIDREVALLQNRALKAKERPKKIKEDSLKDAVYALLTPEFQTAEDIMAGIADEEITKAKVTARLTQLVRAEKVIKETVKVDGRKLMAYALNPDYVAEDSNEEEAVLDF